MIEYILVVNSLIVYNFIIELFDREILREVNILLLIWRDLKLFLVDM